MTDNIPAMLLAQALLTKTIELQKFYRCKCGNDQPYLHGRGRPPCESCGRKAPREKKQP